MQQINTVNDRYCCLYETVFWDENIEKSFIMSVSILMVSTLLLSLDTIGDYIFSRHYSYDLPLN